MVCDNYNTPMPSVQAVLPIMCLYCSTDLKKLHTVASFGVLRGDLPFLVIIKNATTQTTDDTREPADDANPMGSSVSAKNRDARKAPGTLTVIMEMML